MAIRLRFDEVKATSAASYLLSLSGNCLSRLRLIKFLYLADRESFHRYNRPVVGDHYVSMDKGPVLSSVLNLARELEEGEGVWRKAITKDGYAARLKGDPDFSELSPADMEILRDVTTKFRDTDDWELVDYTHTLPEWKDPGGSSRPIAVERILEALNKNADEIGEIAADAADDIAAGLCAT